MNLTWRNYLILLMIGSQWHCFGALHEPMRNYYTLHLQQRQQPSHPPRLGLVRVRDLDAESAYDRFQIVVRKSPFELTYASREVWAVKPNRMLSDLFARALHQRGLFAAVSRELGERRPAYTIGGELYAVELYDSGDLWYAHLSLSMQMTEVATGKTLWAFQKDLRKQVVHQSFAMVVRTLSELASEAFEQGIDLLITELNPPSNAPTEPSPTEPTSSSTAPPPSPPPPTDLQEPLPLLIPIQNKQEDKPLSPSP